MALTKVNNDLQDALAAAQPTITSTGTLTNFTSTGIDDNATSTAITITSDEKVGIGIDSARESLGVADSIVTGDLADSTTTVYRLEPDNSAFIRQLTISDRGGATAGAGKGNAIIFSSKYTGDVQQGMAGIVGISESISGTQKGALAFLTRAHDENPDEKMRISSAGTVGIGVVPEAWNSTFDAIQIGDQASIFGQNSGTQSGFAHNMYFDGAYKYITTSQASRYVQTGGSHVWSVAPSGTADSAISWTTAMAIDNGGRVTMPSQPAFDVHHSGGSYASGTTVTSLDLNTVRLNRGNHYSASNDRFIAPVAGVYVFYYRAIISGTYTNLHIRFRKNGAHIAGGDTHASPTTSGWSQMSSQILLQLAVNDYVQVEHTTNTNIYGDSYQTFQGHLLG